MTAIVHAFKVYPRVGGGNIYRMLILCPEQGLSPRGRGKLRFRIIPAILSGSIPAWAGETERLTAEMPITAVYPRVGGGN